VIYDYRGTVSCVCPNSGTQRQMAYGGFEKDRMTVKYRCPARHYGSSCASLKCCPVGTAVRIALDQDRRVFTPLPRSSLKWQRCYAKRTSVERVNSRLDTSFGFEQHTIRGLTKMTTRCSLALAVMLAMAVGRIKGQQAEAMRSLVKAAACGGHHRGQRDSRGEVCTLQCVRLPLPRARLRFGLVAADADSCRLRMGVHETGGGVPGVDGFLWAGQIGPQRKILRS
jgi:hypothetical protein